jgi:prevent-host-death family protein
MNGLQTVSIRETREQLSELVNQVAIANREFIITKFGKPQAMIIPVKKTVKQKRNYSGLDAAFGMWKDRKDMQNSAKWVANLRHRMSSRYGYGKLFS